VRLATDQYQQDNAPLHQNWLDQRWMMWKRPLMPMSAHRTSRCGVGMIGRFRESSLGGSRRAAAWTVVRQLDRQHAATCEAQPAAQAIAVSRSANGKCFTSPGVIHPNIAVI
jgi:hypothetical protein